MTEGHITSVRVTVDTWNRLKDRKELGMSMDDVINKILDKIEGKA